VKIIAVIEAEIISIIRSLKLKGSKGYDDIHSRILRHSTFKVSNHSVTCAIIHYNLVFILRDFKYSVVQSIYKQDDKTQMTYYRCILLLTTFSNIIENVMLIG
jgi:hypothetical protein